jgi:hypothetical protein
MLVMTLLAIPLLLLVRSTRAAPPPPQHAVLE